jgi:hypothetical protein
MRQKRASESQDLQSPLLGSTAVLIRSQHLTSLLTGGLLAVSALLSGCGVSSPPEDKVAVPVRTLSAQAASQAGTTSAPVDLERLFDWAQARYPEFFPGVALTQSGSGYRYRYYAASGNYAGVADADGVSVYVLGPMSQGEVSFVGKAPDFNCLVRPAGCTPAPPAQTFVADIGGVPLMATPAADFEPGGQFTLEGWIYLSERAGNAWLAGKGLPINGGAGGLRIVYGVGLDEAGERLRFFVGPLSELRAPTALPLRTWVHVAAVLGGGEARLLVNGEVVATRSGVTDIPPAPTLPLGLGAAYDAAGVASPRGVALHARQWRYWRTARSAAQIAAAMPDTLPALRTGLLAAWPLDDRSGAIARDVLGTRPFRRNEVHVGMMRRAVLEDGPHFEAQRVELAAGVLTDPSDLALIDFDSNGWTGLFVAQVAYPPTYPATERRQLALRNVSGRLVDATAAVLGNLQMVNPRRLFSGDFNGDGRRDLFIAETGTDTFPVPGGQSRLLVQSADGRLVDETASRLPRRDEYTHGLAVADVDGNGSLDVFMGNYQPFPSRLLRNDGAGVLSDTSGALPASLTGGMRTAGAAALCDLNGDRRPDLVIGADYYAFNGPGTNRPNELFINDRTGRFNADPSFTLPPKLFGIEGLTPEIACADLNGDGALDLVMSTDRLATEPGLQLLLNDGTGRMRDASAQLNVRYPSSDAWVREILVADINGDGLPDLLLRMNSRDFSPRNYARTILLNRGNAVFVDASEAFNVNAASGMVVGDIDRDGRPDIVTANGANNLIVWRQIKPLKLSLFDD